LRRAATSRSPPSWRERAGFGFTHCAGAILLSSKRGTRRRKSRPTGSKKKRAGAAVEGFDEPLVSGGKLVQDAAGHVVTVRRYSDALLLALLRAHRPERFGKRLSAEPGISGSAVSVDVRTMLLAKLAQLAGDAEAQPRPLPEGHAEPHAPAPAASSAEDA
jgi:hypothetical protein